MNRIILICATIFVFVIGVGCASAADLNEAGDAPALDVVDSVSIVKDDDFSTSQSRPDVQMSASLEHSGTPADHKNMPIIEFQDDKISTSQLRPDVVDRPDVQMSASLKHSGKAADYKDKPIIAFQDDENSPLQLRPDVVDDVSASQIRPDVQKVYIPEKYTNLEKEQNRPIASFWDHVFPFDINNMTECGMGS